MYEEVKDLRLRTCHLSDGRNDGPLADREINLANLKGVQNVRSIFCTNAYNNVLAPKREMEAEETDNDKTQRKQSHTQN